MKAQELEGKVAIVTGGAGGLGRAMVTRLVEEGAAVVIADPDAEAGSGLAAELGDAVAYLSVDVSDVEQVQAAVDLAVSRFGGLQIMVNNAGVGMPMNRFLDDDFSDFQRVVGINLLGTLGGAQRAARHMRDHGGGVIINNASIAALNPGPGMMAYRTSKAAVVHATKCLAIDLAPYGIRVNALTPAHIRTNIGAYDMGPVIKYMQPLQREAQPGDVAEAVVFLASDRAAQITGVVLPVDGGTTAGPPLAQARLIMSQGSNPQS